MPFLMAMALTCAALSATFAHDHRALETRRLRRIHMQRNLVLPHRQHAARMQHLGAVAGDFLRFVVVQRPQQPCRRDGARVGAEHARNVGPDLEAHRGQFGGEVRARGVRAAAAQEHGVARFVRRDESLRDDDPAERSPLLLQARIGREIAGRRQQARFFVGAVAALGAQHPPRIDPGRLDSLRVQETPRPAKSPAARPWP